MKKIEYLIKPEYKISVHDLSVDILFSGYFIYRKKIYKIKTIKTHNGPKFIFEYFEKVSDNIEKILPEINKYLVNKLYEILRDFPDIQEELCKGSFEIIFKTDE